MIDFEQKPFKDFFMIDIKLDKSVKFEYKANLCVIFRTVQT
jgi:hypothetical protein